MSQQPIPFRLLAGLNQLMNIEADINPGKDGGPMADALVDILGAMAVTFGRSFDEFLDLVAAAGGARVIEEHQIHAEPEVPQ